MFSGYIPTSSLLSTNNLEQYRDNSVAYMKIYVFDLTGSPYPVKGVDTFTVQHNPAMIEEPEIKANYASHTGLGRVQEQIHYLNTTSSPVSFQLIITDAYEGPPHSSVDGDGNIIRQDFNNLLEVSSFFKGLTTPPAEWGKPPFVRVALGGSSVFGVITSVRTTWLKMYKNGIPMIGRIDFTVKPDVLDSSQEVAFYEVR
jgi:hypothetical protein